MLPDSFEIYHQDREVTFERYDPDGFDHMRMPGYALDIPSEAEELIRRLSALFPAYSDSEALPRTPAEKQATRSAERIRQFVHDVEKTGTGLKILASPIKPTELLKYANQVFCKMP